jgi:LmbE family N-acetylglucosaminyl deacetylase
VAVELVVDELNPGTDEQTWLSASQLASLPLLGERRPRRLVVVAPHPDDEVLGAGGLLQYMTSVGVEAVLVAVTDGEASHPGDRAFGQDLSAIRAIETQVALIRLGIGSTRVERLGFADGSVADRCHDLTDHLRCMLEPDDLCVAPWRRDGHPDHDATGVAAVSAARSIRTPILEYLVWAWHWATPESTDVPWHRCGRLELGRRQAARKRWATHAFTTQIRPFGPDHDGRPLLPDSVLRRFWRPFEIFIESEP